MNCTDNALHSPFCLAPSQTNWLNQKFNVLDNLCFSGTVRAWISKHLRLATSTSKVEDLLCCSCHSSKTFLLYCVAFGVALLWLNADYFQTVWQLHIHMMNMTNLIFWHDVLSQGKSNIGVWPLWALRWLAVLNAPKGLPPIFICYIDKAISSTKKLSSNGRYILFTFVLAAFRQLMRNQYPSTYCF